VRAERVSSEEKKRLWPTVTAAWPDFDDYQRRTERDIPVIRLARR
jgi:hypothetical protein